MALQTTTDRKAFGKLLKAYRQTQNMQQRELAKRAHVPIPHLCQLEGGQRPCGPALTNKLAAALRITDQKELFRFYAAGRKTMSLSRQKTMERMLVTHFLRAVESELRQHAGNKLEKVVFLSSMSVAGSRKPRAADGTFLMLADGTRIFPALRIESPAP